MKPGRSLRQYGWYPYTQDLGYLEKRVTFETVFTQCLR